MLFEPLRAGAFTLNNRMLMAPLTRARADAGHMPGAPLNAPDASTFYTPGAKGYTDYPTM